MEPVPVVRRNGQNPARDIDDRKYIPAIHKLENDITEGHGSKDPCREGGKMQAKCRT